LTKLDFYLNKIYICNHNFGVKQTVELNALILGWYISTEYLVLTYVLDHFWKIASTRL